MCPFWRKQAYLIEAIRPVQFTLEKLNSAQRSEIRGTIPYIRDSSNFGFRQILENSKKCYIFALGQILAFLTLLSFSIFAFRQIQAQ